MNRKGFTITKTIFYVIGLILFIIGLVFATQAFRVEPIRVETASKEIVSTTTLHRIVSSDRCLSVGESGVLNKTKLDEAKGKGAELECAFVPNGAYNISVRDRVTNSLWSFGHSYTPEAIVLEEAVTIVYPNGESHPANMTYRFTFRDTDLLLYITDQAAATFYTGKEEIVTVYKTKYAEWDIKGNGAEVCATRALVGGKGKNPTRCKKLYDGIKVRVDHPRTAKDVEYQVVTRKDGDFVVVALRR